MQTPWLSPPPSISLSPGQMHVFRLELRLECADRGLEELLDAEEAARAQRYRFEDDRRRFICAHGQVRRVLGALLGTGPAEPVFQKNEYGKPFLPDSAVCFNLSHSRELALLGVCIGQQVGVDVEVIRPEVDYEGIASRFFSPEEVGDLLSLTSEQRMEGFFNAWTRKEAYIKARGLGLKIPLRQFAVTLSPGQPARLVHPEPGAPGVWSMFALTPGPGYCGAAVVEGPTPELFCWEWDK